MSTEFTQQEAEALVGRKIRTKVEFSGVPRHTTGTVTSADMVAGHWDVAITWHMPEEEPKVAMLNINGESALYVRTGGRLTDWFDGSEFDEYLELLP